MPTQMIAGRVYNYSHVIGRNATGGNGFRLPIDPGCGEGNTIYVLSPAHEYQPFQRVSLVTLDEEFIKEFGGPGERDGQFIWPSALALDSQGRVYVADEWLNRITVFDKGGNFLSKWGKTGAGPGELDGPAGLAFDAEDNLYITEHRNNRAQKFTKDGQYLLGWGQAGAGPGEFDMPWGIAVDRQGHVYVADWHNHRVQKFTADGQFLAQIGKQGRDAGELKLPSDVAVDKDGDIYVVEQDNNRVQVFAPDGSPIISFIGDAQRLSKWAQATIDANPDYQKARMRVKTLEPEWRFTRPTAVTLDAEGRIIVADTQRHRLQVYRKEENWTDPQFNL